MRPTKGPSRRPGRHGRPVNAWAGESLADLADTVRHNVIAAITDHTQLSVAAVDVDIDDLDLPLR